MSLRVHEPGTLTTVQDQGRFGHAHLGVPRAGALDRPAADLANRLVGNPTDAAVLEVTLGGLLVEWTGTDAGLWVAVTGADGAVSVSGRALGHTRPEFLAPGGMLRVGIPDRGVRSYLAVAGGIAVAPVLGSRSTDTLGWVGPPRVVAGQLLAVGAAYAPISPLDTPRPPVPGPLRILRGPREDWFAAGSLAALRSTSYVVSSDSDRIGLRLDGPALRRSRDGELASEGMVAGAVQVPPSGTPVVFLADHPCTGGYPVLGVVHPDDLWQCAQLRPGESVRFS